MRMSSGKTPAAASGSGRRYRDCNWTTCGGQQSPGNFRGTPPIRVMAVASAVLWFIINAGALVGTLAVPYTSGARTSVYVSARTASHVLWDSEKRKTIKEVGGIRHPQQMTSYLGWSPIDAERTTLEVPLTSKARRFSHVNPDLETYR